MRLDQSSRIYPENTARFFILIALAGVIPAGFGFLSAVLAKNMTARHSSPRSCLRPPCLLRTTHGQVCPHSRFSFINNQ